MADIQDALLFAPSQKSGTRESSLAGCVGTQSVLPQALPKRPLALCLNKWKGNKRAPAQVRSPFTSHPGNPESFRCVCGWGFPGISLPQTSPCGCGPQVCGMGVSTPQGRPGGAGWGGSRQHLLARKTPRPQGHLLRPGWVPEQTHVSEAAEFQAGRSSHHTGQAQLSRLQTGLADGQCHFRASQLM